MKTCVALVFSILALGCEAATPAVGEKTGPKHVLLIRHAEKPPEELGEAGLNAKGKVRAAALYELFEASDKRQQPFPKPDFLFAAATSKKSVRSIETAKPLGKKLGLPVNDNFDDDDFAKLTSELFRNPKYVGKTVLIVWKHHALPPFAEKLGAADAPKDWKDGVFDRVWQLDFDDGKVTFRDRPQELP
ncbi:histidine phosphatase family protein [Limnoglobus roseus]|uniref:Histidine phosphatase family protein n=1 Tax=Limnoglobus roseus TaxID=2598579 RepID=A0A5C1AEW5_9BACT|nr:histidine phosphatase family protein [Limnoglobus roseus]QEL15664.1 histidine phosphatase family protein [Limnoglobus roseus]